MRVNHGFAYLKVLALAVAATSFASCQQQPITPASPTPTPIRYTLTGNLIIINECVGGGGAIPVSVKVSASLEDAAGKQLGRTSPANVSTVSGPPNSKTGSYSITIEPPSQDPGGFGTPVSWTNFVIRRTDNTSICTFECTDKKRCTDVANQGDIDVAPVGQPTNFDIRARCSCVQEPEPQSTPTP